MLGRRGRRLFDGTPEGSGRQQRPARTPAPSSLLASCPACGDVVVDVVGTIVRGGPAPATCRYCFVCPSCRRPVEIVAPDHLAAVLVCLGAVELTGEVEPHEPGPPISVDDLLDLMLDLGLD